MKKKVVKLQESAPQEHTLLIGISSHENDYRLSWAINTTLELKLAKSRDIEIPVSKSGQHPSFSSFRYHDEHHMQQYMLIANASEQGYLFPEYKNIDFILKITGETETLASTQVTGRLKTIDIITLAFEIPVQAVKNAKYLLWEQ